MVNYQNGKIYKIVALDGTEDEIYIGATAKKYLSQRMQTHRDGKLEKMEKLNHLSYLINMVLMYVRLFYLNHIHVI